MASSDDSEETPECRVCLEDLRLRQLETGIHTTLSSAPVFSDRSIIVPLLEKVIGRGRRICSKRLLQEGLFKGPILPSGGILLRRYTRRNGTRSFALDVV